MLKNVLRKAFCKSALQLVATTALFASMSVGLVGCGQKAGSAKNSSVEQTAVATRSFTDSCGREVELPQKIEKVAVSGPLAQQVLLTIAPEKLVGLSTKLGDSAKYFPDVNKDLPVFGQIYGGKGDFNKEAVAEAAPDLVIDIGEAKKTIVEDMDNLQDQLNIPCVHIEASIDSYADAYKLLGELLGKEDRAKELADYCEKAYTEVNDVVSKVAEADRPRVAYLLGDAGLNAMSKGGFQAKVVDMVANNAIEVEKPKGSGMGNEVNLEQIAAADPELIVFGPKSIFKTVDDDPAWAGIAAIKNKNYYQVPSEPYNWLSGPPSVNQVLGMQWLARVCYPDSFKTSAEDVAKDYYKTFYNYDLADEEVQAIMDGSIPRAS